MPETTTLTIRISTETKERLEKLAAQHNRSKAYLTVQALERYLDEEGYITRRIRKGVELADREQFVPDDEVEALFRKWGA
ncbi:MAG: CopG family ribbon-helix-helix protein [Burkholderiales bacterium]